MTRLYGLIGHEPIVFDDVIAWAEAWELLRERGLNIVRQDCVGAIEVSTVFLGIDYRHLGRGRPLLFETMTFPGSELVARYATWDEALAGHEAHVKTLTGELTKATN